MEEKVPVEQLTREGPGYPGHPDIQAMMRGHAPGDLVERPEHKVFSLAMLGGGMVYGAAHPYDYPWASLGEATVVDVGGGLGECLGRLSALLTFQVASTFN